MAETTKKRKKRKKKSLGGYFRKILGERPEWLDSPSNADVLARYQADHPGRSITPKLRSNLANVKSLLRKQGRKGGKTSPRGGSAGALENLEVSIDNCLSTARKLDPNGLDPVIRALRRARNEVVWKIGQPKGT